MSHLHPGDEDMHHCDNSHRWTAPPEFEQHVWAAQVRAHMQEHLTTMGGPPPVPDSKTCVPRHLYVPPTSRPTTRRVRRPAPTASTGQRVVAVARTTPPPS